MKTNSLTAAELTDIRDFIAELWYVRGVLDHHHERRMENELGEVSAQLTCAINEAEAEKENQQ